MKHGSCEQPGREPERFQSATSPQPPPVMSWDLPFSPGMGVGRSRLTSAGAHVLSLVTTAQSSGLLSTYCAQSSWDSWAGASPWPAGQAAALIPR